MKWLRKKPLYAGFPQARAQCTLNVVTLRKMHGRIL